MVDVAAHSYVPITGIVSFDLKGLPLCPTSINVGIAKMLMGLRFFTSVFANFGCNISLILIIFHC